MSEEKDITVRLVHLSNRSRKGTYVYIKAKGIPSRYFKHNEDIPLDVTRKYYVDKYIIKDSPYTFSQYAKSYTNAKISPDFSKRIRSYLTKVKKQQKMSTSFKEGITSYTIPKALSADETHIRASYKHLLSPLIMDSGLLDKLTLEENINRIKYRFEHKVHFLDEKNNVLIEGTSIARYTTAELIEQLKRRFKKGMALQDANYSPEFKHMLGDLKLSSEFRKKGTLAQIAVTTVFRKSNVNY